ncbi:MAG: sucrose phosphorylase [Anaerolineae bacterium]|nr:sucrose phosphorylase [Anaerolineae bacterium]
MKNQVHLISYPNRLGGSTLKDLSRMLAGPLDGLFAGVHILPFFLPVNGADAGFDPIDHGTVDPQVGDWQDIQALGERTDITADLIVNHISVHSPQFSDFRQKGESSAHKDVFLSYRDVFPEGATEQALAHIYRPRPGLPFTRFLIAGQPRVLWTTFTDQQVDINVYSEAGWNYLQAILEVFAAHGVRTVRLDAVGYACKKQGTSCFMIPETFEFIRKLSHEAKTRGMEVLVEIHSHYQSQIAIAAHVDRVYDFALPPLVLHAIFRGTARYLKQWLHVSPRNAVTVLDTHDGIGVIDIGPGVVNGVPADGILPEAEIGELVETIHRRSRGESLRATGKAARNLDLYQVNCTFYDALGGRDDEYLLARALQFFAPGIPQVYYVGLLAGRNDVSLLQKTGEGRDINRHWFTEAEVLEQMRLPVVQKLSRLIRFRNTHPAFQGDVAILDSPDDSALRLRWTAGPEWAELAVDFQARTFRITGSEAGEGSIADFSLSPVDPRHD